MLAAFDSLLLERIAQWIGEDYHGYQVAAFISVVLISAICGLVGAQVVGNRMAFFSDAMAHCAFAGLSLGLIIAFWMNFTAKSDELQWLLPLLMALFGALIGFGIAFVRDKTGLASDTVIGVFFAAAIGFGAMILEVFKGDRRLFDPERFLFGGPALAQPFDLLLLLILLVLTVLVLMWRYNQFVLASFNPSLARSRGMTVGLNGYIFIVLLALIVNFSITTVGVLLINALLIVPAATASNFSSTMRSLFGWTFFISIATGVAGLWISQSMRLTIQGEPKQFGVSGTIICLGVVFFALSMLILWLRRRYAHLG
jgi:zinc transport system permease protein